MLLPDSELTTAAFGVERISYPIRINGVTYYEIQWAGETVKTLEPELNPDIKGIIQEYGISEDEQERRRQRDDQREAKKRTKRRRVFTEAKRRQACREVVIEEVRPRRRRQVRRTVRKERAQKTHKIMKSEIAIQTEDSPAVSVSGRTVKNYKRDSRRVQSVDINGNVVRR